MVFVVLCYYTKIKGRDMIITITGRPCSGKSTVAKVLVERYGFTRIGVGDIFKEEAQKKGMTIEEFTELRLKDQSFDLFIDKEIERIGKERTDENIIFDSRMAWHFVPNSFKVFVDLDEDEMANRLINREGIGKYKDFKTAKKAVLKRQNSDNKIYKKIYGVDCTDLKNYDYVVESLDKTPEQIADEIWNGLLTWNMQKNKI